MHNIRDRLAAGNVLIGMVHVGALPGTPHAREPVRDLVRRAAQETRIYTDGGFDAVMIENMHDRPYLRRHVGPEIIASMTAVAAAVREATDLPLGIQVLAGANCAAMAIAHACGFQFIRTEGFVFASVADEGLLEEADAGPLLRYRRMIGAEDVAILADVRKKHAAHAITDDVSLAEQVKAAAFFGADAAIITGHATGDPVAADDLTAAAQAKALPIVIGSGATATSLAALLREAHGVIVGSACKQDGRWDRPVDPERVRAIVKARTA